MFDFGSIMGGLGAIGGIADSIFGSSDEEKALKLAKKQFKLQKKLALAGFDDGRGMKVYWNPDAGPTGEGEWQIDYTGMAQLQEDTSNQNEYARLLEEGDLAAGRKQNRAQRDSMRPIIDSYINELRNQDNITPEQLQGDLNYLSGSALDDVYNKAQGDIARAAIRSPGAFAARSGPAAGLVSGLAKDKKDAMVENRLKALTGADEINQQRRGNLINSVNSLSANAFNLDDIPFQPSQLGAIGTSVAQNNANRAPAGLSAGLQGVLAAQPQPNNGNLFGQIGAGLGSLYDSINSGFNTKPGNPTGLGNKTQSQHTAYLQNYNLDRAF